MKNKISSVSRFEKGRLLRLNRLKGDDVRTLLHGSVTDEDLFILAGQASSKYLWSCHVCGGCFSTTIYERLRRDGRAKSLCNVCATDKRGRLKTAAAIKSNGSLLSKHPVLSEEFNEERNKISAANVAAGSCTKYWWLCKLCGNEWEAKVGNRTIQGKGCPKCRDFSTSKLEKRIFSELSTFPFEVQLRADVGGFESDVFLPEFNIAIEHDGYPWHLGKQDRDLQKESHWSGIGVTLVRVRDDQLKPMGKHCITYKEQGERNFMDVVSTLFRLLHGLGVPVLGAIESYENGVWLDDCGYQESLRGRVSAGGLSLADLFPEVASEWDYKKNHPLVPGLVSKSSGIMVWWVCCLGHEWKARISNRTSLGRGCPTCASERALKLRRLGYLKGGNTLAEKAPALAMQLDVELSGFSASDVSGKSNRLAHWLCECGHKWSTSVANRNQIKSRGIITACPSCRVSPSID